MTPAARLQAAIEIVDLVIESARDNGPAADAIVSNWFKSRRFAGSKDRRAVRDHVYAAIRNYDSPPSSGRAAMLGLGQEILFDGSPYGPAPRADGEVAARNAGLPGWLSVMLDPEDVAASAGRAPLDLRVCAEKISPAEVMAQLPGTSPIDGLPNGLRLDDSPGVDQNPLLREGHVEIQDAGSQFVAKACNAEPGQTVIDLCAGAGGKTLALADAMSGQGRLIACDTARNRLNQLSPRAIRAGAFWIEARLLDPGKELAALSDLAAQGDCVLVDAPCSGTGTWRRNPELRWRLTQARLQRTLKLQAHVLDLGAVLVKPGGRLVYAVCSLLAEEGERQISAFLSRNPDFNPVSCGITAGRDCGAGRVLTPFRDATDGFFVAALAKAC